MPPAKSAPPPRLRAPSPVPARAARRPPSSAPPTEGAAPVGRAYAGLSQEDRVAARRARLVAAGIALFGGQGLRATTVRGVCREAGLTDRYFYESFAGLEDLLEACSDVLLGRLRVALLEGAEKASGVSAEARFTAGYEAWVDFVSEPAAARIMLAEVLGVSPALDARYEAGMREFADALTGPLTEAGARGAQAALIARALVGAVVQVAKMWAANGYREHRADVVRSCVLVAVGTVRALRRERAAAAPRSA